MAKHLVAATIAAGATLVAACGGGESAETTSEPGEIVFELESEGGAQGVRARLTYESNNRTGIVVDGLDEGEPAGGGPNPVRLIGGTCDEPGAVMASLEQLSGAESSSQVNFGLGELMAGNFAIEVALPGSKAGEIVACGNVPDEAP